jgi:hypothetical protein
MISEPDEPDSPIYQKKNDGNRKTRIDYMNYQIIHEER